MGKANGFYAAKAASQVDATCTRVRPGVAICKRQLLGNEICSIHFAASSCAMSEHRRHSRVARNTAYQEGKTMNDHDSQKFLLTNQEVPVKG